MAGGSVLLIILALLLLSCATKSDAYKDIDHAVHQNHYDKAVEAIVKSQDGKKPIYPEKNSIMLYLDKGLLEHYAGNYKQSSQDLQEAERLIEEAFTKSVTAGFMSYIANDNTKEYPGEDFEDIYLNVFNALNYYKNDNVEGALVEIRKLSLSSGKLDMLGRKYEDARKGFADKAMETLNKLGLSLNDALPSGEPINFSNSALARFLAALFFLADKNTDGARIEFDQLQAAFDSNKNVYSNPVPQAVAEARSVPAGMARLNVIAFSGLCPVKDEMIFTQSWPLMQNADLQKAIFKFPVFVDRPSRIDRIEVEAGGQKFNLELLEDMGLVIKETYKAGFANLFFKTYLRVLGKYVAGDIAATVLGESQGPTAAKLSAFGAKKAADASEGADIRMSRYLPNKAYIGGINLEPGTYDIRINFYHGNSAVAHEDRKGVEVKAGGINLVDAISLK